MNSAKIKSFLEVTTNVAVLVVAMIFLGSLIWNYFHQKPIPQLHAGLEKGVALAQVPGVDYSQSPQTLLIAMNIKCGYCQESVPFYNQLIAEQQRGNKQTRLIALFPESSYPIG